jgi:tight adherence protein C
MDPIFDVIDFLIRDPFTLALALGVALALGGFVFAGQWAVARADVRRRTSRASNLPLSSTENKKSAAPISERQLLLARLTTSIDKFFGEGDQAASKILRKSLVQAGYYGTSTPAIFLTLRVAGLVLGGALGFLVGTLSDDHLSTIYIKMVGGAGIGYFAPSLVLDRIISKRKAEHLSGFPDFLDLMIVCCEAGLSMEAAINRVCREMADAYPSLSANLYFASLEIRAGRSVNDALTNLAGRLGIEEARTFATLLQQSAELGSSLIDSLKIYSDEMRNKRMMRAEEKANALPTKMMIPMMVFIFPILFIILLFPAYMRVKEMWI